MTLTFELEGQGHILFFMVILWVQVKVNSLYTTVCEIFVVEVYLKYNLDVVTLKLRLYIAFL